MNCTVEMELDNYKEQRKVGGNAYLVAVLAMVHVLAGERREVVVMIDVETDRDRSGMKACHLLDSCYRCMDS
jgi:hypothetical protein